MLLRLVTDGDATVEFNPDSGWNGNVFLFAPQLAAEVGH
jgi:hypothetical protein